MTRPVSAYVPRSERKPLYVKVVTEPSLHGCWAVNISETGIGLIATPRTTSEGPRESEAVEMSFLLPGTGAHVRVRGDVRWRHDMTGAAGMVAALGVSFRAFEGSDGLKLARYLATAHVQVAVAFASAEEARGLRMALEGQATPHFASTLPDAHALLARGDMAALLVCGNVEEQALELVERLAVLRAEVDPSGAGPPSDLASRIIYCAPAAPERLVALFNTGRIFRALGPEPRLDLVRQAVLQACREHGVRTEQWRMALELERNLLRERALSHAPAGPGRGSDDVGFRSAAMQRVMEMVRLVAPHRVAVLLQGETGTGKEVLARILHRLSGRGDVPLVVQDCGALTETLLESELFGHVKGAFTGAVADHPGLFVLANGGTVFLDEIENTTPNLQAKLLRVLETGDVRPVGGTQVRHVDVRVVAASNRDLGEEVRAGRFRADLFYRLNSFTLDIPPLRDRPEDIPELARAFLDQFNLSLKRSATGVAPDAAEVLRGYAWPGNVRELRNVMERAVLLSRPGEVVTRRLLPPGMLNAVPPRGEQSSDGSLRARLHHVERELIREALERHGGVLRRAAVALGMDPVTLGRRARRHGLWKAD
ncbi:sigma-54-dependent Fis family transcriptional regulator [Corallococcus sp. H22C18031201]|uniref:sigma 54-interacting transcriptional regulator n=1 Tax=Citreicoccus inhibens TaxID=2849499 RepID=UPI000E71A897|nr:sigma 54-interacting transcriptional regulator [Citreicoccus inhibens]MBU8896915.1 sigma 54-interacting transcriptional regulator [Citreicoccus inhibens]RJS20808.1 sigma-54-dependent Fis family transcriptional regulator [Corallococcus sp. H22C18031201]